MFYHYSLRVSLGAKLLMLTSSALIGFNCWDRVFGPHNFSSSLMDSKHDQQWSVSRPNKVAHDSFNYRRIFKDAANLWFAIPFRGIFSNFITTSHEQKLNPPVAVEMLQESEPRRRIPQAQSPCPCGATITLSLVKANKKWEFAWSRNCWCCPRNECESRCNHWRNEAIDPRHSKTEVIGWSCAENHRVGYQRSSQAFLSLEGYFPTPLWTNIFWRWGLEIKGKNRKIQETIVAKWSATKNCEKYVMHAYGDQRARAHIWMVRNISTLANKHRSNCLQNCLQICQENFVHQGKTMFWSSRRVWNLKLSMKSAWKWVEAWKYKKIDSHKS